MLFIKCEIRHFHVVVVQWWQKNVQKVLCTCKVVIKPTCIATWAFCFFLLSLDLKVPTAGGFYNPAKTSIPSRGSCNTPRCFMLLKLGQAVAAQIFLACACLKLSCIFFFRCLSYFWHSVLWLVWGILFAKLCSQLWALDQRTQRETVHLMLFYTGPVSQLTFIQLCHSRLLILSRRYMRWEWEFWSLINLL